MSLVRPRSLAPPMVVLLLVVSSRADPVGATLTLESAVDRALASHPSVAASEASLEEARASAGEASAAYFPSLALNGAATRFEKPALVAPIHSFAPGQPLLFNRTTAQGSATLSFTLFDGGGREARVRRTRSQTAAARAGLTAAEQALAGRVIDAYLAEIAAREVLAAHGQRMDALESERERLHQFFDAGRAAEVEILRMEAAVASAAADQVTYEAALENAERDLARLIGTSPDSTRAERLDVVALTDTAAAPREALLEEARRASPALDQARRRAAAASAARAEARSVRWPQLRLAASLNDYGDSQTLHESDEWNAGVQVSLPIFTGGAIAHRIQAADAAARESEARLAMTELDVQQDLDLALAGVKEARARVASLTKAVARFTEVVRVETLLLESGSETETEYLGAEADLLGSRAALVEARHAEIRARADLARITGRLDADWIRTNLEALP